MIYTCTANPSLDYYLTFDDINLGTNNRSEMEIFEAGGKGVNVSIVLNNFQIPSSCLGFLGGFTKDFYLSYISKFPFIQPLFTTINDNTRINVKLMDNKNETSLNAKGPFISNSEFDKFKLRLNKVYKDDYFILSGNIGNDIKDKMVEVIHELSRDGVKIILDADDDIVKKCIDAGIFMVKLNDYFLNDYKLDVFKASKELIDLGIKYVLYSNAGKPSYLFTSDITLKCKNLENNLINSTGSSDSLVAGALYGIIRGADPIECFKYANAASLATSLSNDLGSKEKIEELYDSIEVEEI